jgi:hypothetical protein
MIEEKNRGIRIKDPFIRNVSVDLVAKAYAKEGFNVQLVSRTARCLSVKVKHSFRSAPGVECCSRVAIIKIGDEGVIFRWSGVPPKEYYHMDSEHQSEVSALESKSISTWTKFERKLKGKEK